MYIKIAGFIIMTLGWTIIKIKYSMIFFVFYLIGNAKNMLKIFY